MAIGFGRKQFGLFQNYNFEDGTDRGWATGARSIYVGESNDDVPTNKYSLRTYSRWSSSAWSADSLEVDTSKLHTLSYRVKGHKMSTNANGDNVRNPRHYLGFSCFDENNNFIRLEHCGGVGNTTLSRPLNQGDSYVYLTSSSGWPTGADITSTRYYFRALILYPPTHPKYSAPYEYSRIGTRGGADGGSGEHYIKSLVQTPQGDWEGKLCNANNTDRTWNYTEPYPLPAGTPISRGVAGGTYNYCFGRRQYAVNGNWTTLITTFSGENRNSGTPFRYATKYIKAMILHNYALPNDGGSIPYPESLFDRMLFIENDGNKYDFN